MWVEGHVSAALHGKAHARKLSKQRASLCAAMIRARLLVLDASLNAAHAEGLVAAVGLGNEKPLPGFDDGGNYADSRMVVLGDSQEGTCLIFPAGRQAPPTIRAAQKNGQAIYGVTSRRQA